jgi:hypothetical protein
LTRTDVRVSVWMVTPSSFSETLRGKRTWARLLPKERQRP